MFVISYISYTHVYVCLMYISCVFFDIKLQIFSYSCYFFVLIVKRIVNAIEQTTQVIPYSHHIPNLYITILISESRLVYVTVFLFCYLVPCRRIEKHEENINQGTRCISHVKTHASHANIFLLTIY